ncbi:TA system antitoxin ParD family protein [Salinisphaera hydrothermalis]|uniref:TA system antitoxin ParD family protein n=1 Tax=Salinisphaera hydrothermalis TaxID=563188 RepID=UPI003341C259
MATESVRLSRAILGQARKEAGVMSRTLQAQLEHWARVGQAIENAPGYDRTKVHDALRGHISPDELDPYERSVYDVEHEAIMEKAGDEERAFFKQLADKQRAAGVNSEDLGT